MRLIFTDIEREYLNILTDILSDEGIYYKEIEERSNICGNGYWITTYMCPSINTSSTVNIEVNTDYEKFEYVKYLYNNIVKKLKKKQRKQNKDIKYLEACFKQSKKKKRNSKTEYFANGGMITVTWEDQV